MSMRGAQKADALTITSSMVGVFRTDPRTREEFLSLATGNSKKH
jgi:GTP cyclohydrolase IA